MITADINAQKRKATGYQYKLIKIETTEGKASTVSLDRNLYKAIEGKIGAEAAITIARAAALKFENVRTNKTRSAYVVNALRKCAHTKAEKPITPKYRYAKLRVRAAQGNLTTVSLPPSFMARARRKLTDEQIRAIADAATAAYDKTAIFTRSECIKRALKERLGENVPSELQVFRRKFRLTNAQLASILKVSPKELAQWEAHDRIDSGPARMLLALLWRKHLKLSAIRSRVRLGISD